MNSTLENTVKAKEALEEAYENNAFLKGAVKICAEEAVKESQTPETKAIQQVDEEKDIITGPKDIDDYKEFWGSSISRNRYLKEKEVIEDRKIEVQGRVDWVENQIYTYLTDKKGCEEVCSILVFSEFEDLLNFWNKVLFYEVQKELFKKGIRLVIAHNFYLKPFWKKKKTASFEVFATFLQSDPQVDAALERHYSNRGSKLGFQMSNIEGLKLLFVKKILGAKK